MEFIQLNHGWNADPNAPEPTLTVCNDDLIVTFSLNHFMYPKFSTEDEGTLIFHRCFQYYLGSPNDEGFYMGQGRYKMSDVRWGEFYRVDDSDWRDTFPDPVLVSPGNDVPGAKHYLFYFRDETLEVIAQDFEFLVNGVAYS